MMQSSKPAKCFNIYIIDNVEQVDRDEEKLIEEVLLMTTVEDIGQSAAVSQGTYYQ